MTTNIVTGLRIRKQVSLSLCSAFWPIQGIIHKDKNQLWCLQIISYIYIYKNHSFAYPCYYSSLALFPVVRQGRGKKRVMPDTYAKNRNGIENYKMKNLSSYPALSV